MIDQPTEAKRFDPDGRYVRRWLPVLARLPAQWIHQPWLAPEIVLADAGGWRAGGHRGVGRGETRVRAHLPAQGAAGMAVAQFVHNPCRPCAPLFAAVQAWSWESTTPGP